MFVYPYMLKSAAVPPTLGERFVAPTFQRKMDGRKGSPLFLVFDWNDTLTKFIRKALETNSEPLAQTRTPDLLSHGVSHTLKNIKFKRNLEIKTIFLPLN